MESLGIDIRLIIIQIVNFGILLAVLTRFLYKPILKILDERKKRIAESLVIAQKIEEEKIKLEERKKEELRKARETGGQIIKEMRDEGAEQRELIVGLARQEAEKITKKTHEQLVLEKEKMRHDLRREVGELAILIVEKLLEERLTSEKKGELIGQSLKKLKGEDFGEISPKMSYLISGKGVSPQAVKIASEILVVLKRTQNMRLLPQILEKLEENIMIKTEVITAGVLEAGEQKKMRTTLEEILGENINIKFKVNPKILGGMVVKVGDKVFDNSLVGKANQLKESLQ
ncbi:MAG: F0F1 ATP synthase subunit B [bacterium]|nr:F0F1 ATP synthase subunit B [bacterium]